MAELSELFESVEAAAARLSGLAKEGAAHPTQHLARRCRELIRMLARTLPATEVKPTMEIRAEPVDVELGKILMNIHLEIERQVALAKIELRAEIEVSVDLVRDYVAELDAVSASSNDAARLYWIRRWASHFVLEGYSFSGFAPGMAVDMAEKLWDKLEGRDAATPEEEEGEP